MDSSPAWSDDYGTDLDIAYEYYRRESGSSPDPGPSTSKRARPEIESGSSPDPGPSTSKRARPEIESGSSSDPGPSSPKRLSPEIEIRRWRLEREHENDSDSSSASEQPLGSGKRQRASINSRGQGGGRVGRRGEITGRSRGEGRATRTRGEGRGTRSRGESRGRARGESRGRARGESRGRARGESRGRVRGESRGRVRGEGRGRARGGVRGTRSRAGSNGAGAASQDVDRIKRLREARQEKLREDITKLSLEEMRELLFRTIERRPGMLFDIMQPVPPPGDDRHNNVPWCTCGRCREMPTDVERLCCGRAPQGCLSQHAVFELIVDEPALLIQRAMWADLYNLEEDPQEPDQDNRAMRHAGYRSYIFWQHGRLGQGNRRVIPSCCVTKIRSLYPSITGIYTGYLPGRFV